MEFRKIGIPKNVENGVNRVQKNDLGFREVRKGQICAPDPLGAVLDPKNQLKDIKTKVLGWGHLRPHLLTLWGAQLY